jgi:diadenosine tetraphosphatase ApaH/serine/threonine PP2A family protein phosphatase
VEKLIITYLLHKVQKNTTTLNKQGTLKEKKKQDRMTSSLPTSPNRGKKRPLPDVPIFQTGGDESPIPPTEHAHKRTWALADPFQDKTSTSTTTNNNNTMTTFLPPPPPPSSSSSSSSNNNTNNNTNINNNSTQYFGSSSNSTINSNMDDVTFMQQLGITQQVNEYGSDDEEKELMSLSESELRTRCLSLMRAAAKHSSTSSSPSLGLLSSPLAPTTSPTTSSTTTTSSAAPSPRASLSPAMYAVHNRSGAVRRLKLGRTASIATRDALNTLPSNHQVVEDETIVRTSHIFKQSQTYLTSNEFADDILILCERVSNILEKETRVLEIKSPSYVFGDIHGNVDDLKFFADHVWPLGMPLTAGNFLFLGDYVDRGAGGLEVLAYLWSNKIQCPEKIYLLRGNHETRSVNGWEEYYGNGSFLAQCRNRFGDRGYQIWEECNRVFDRMPLAAIIDRTIFCVHGGIPRPPRDSSIPDTRLDDIRKIPCPIEVRQPTNGQTPEELANRLAFSLLWSDPADSFQEPFLERETGFGNSVRGSGSVIFGLKAVEQFLARFQLGYIMRAHEATVNGINVSKSAKVLTVFSTSKDHGCGGDAKCGCVLVDSKKISAIIRSTDYGLVPNSPMASSSLNTLSGAAVAVATGLIGRGGGSNDLLSDTLVANYVAGPVSTTSPMNSSSNTNNKNANHHVISSNNSSGSSNSNSEMDSSSSSTSNNNNNGDGSI